MAATTVGNLVFFAGGHDGTAAVDVVDVYDADTGERSTDTLSQARHALSATTVGKQLIFAGGLAIAERFMTLTVIYLLMSFGFKLALKELQRLLFPWWRRS